MSRRLLIPLLLLAHAVCQLSVAYDSVAHDKSGRDFASYYYGVQATYQGQDPYLTANLNQLSKKGERKKSVHPYFYPPPYLMAVSWAIPLTLKQATLVMLALNELLLALCLGLLVLGFGAPLWAVSLVVVGFTPIPDNAWMGQANLMALLPALAGVYLSRKREHIGGILVGIAGMLKMSPAFFLLHLGVERRFRAVLAAILTAIVTSVLALPLVSFSDQLRFYTEVLPGFGSGDYNGLAVPITLNANHSWPDLLNRMFPGNGDKLSPTGQLLSTTSLILALLGFVGWSRQIQSDDIRVEGLKFSVLSVLLVVLPVYTYEHHFVALLPAVLLAASALTTRGQQVWFGVTFFCLSWPLDWLRWAQKTMPALAPVFRESKFFGAISLCLLCAVLARSIAQRSDPGPIAPERAPE